MNLWTTCSGALPATLVAFSITLTRQWDSAFGYVLGKARSCFHTETILSLGGAWTSYNQSVMGAVDSFASITAWRKADVCALFDWFSRRMAFVSDHLESGAPLGPRSFSLPCITDCQTKVWSGEGSQVLHRLPGTKDIYSLSPSRSATRLCRCMGATATWRIMLFNSICGTPGSTKS